MTGATSPASLGAGPGGCHMTGVMVPSVAAAALDLECDAHVETLCEGRILGGAALVLPLAHGNQGGTVEETTVGAVLDPGIDHITGRRHGKTHVDPSFDA